MKLKDVAGMFNRAWEYAFNVRKFLFMFLTLVIVGLIFLFFQAVSPESNPWMQLAFRYAPFFVATALLTAMGAFLIKIYLHEKEETEEWKYTFITSLKPFWIASSIAISLLGAFIGIWILQGFLILLKSIPYIGPFLGVILAFVPFVLNLSIVLLLVAILGTLFFFTPIIAIHDQLERKWFTQRLQADLFTHVISLLIAFLPVWITWVLVKNAALMTFEVYSAGDNQSLMVLQAFFMLIPFSAAMAFPLIYFFNFALESFQLLEKKNVPERENVSLGL